MPSRLRTRLRRHLGWPLLLLVACIGVAAVAVGQAQREARSHRRTAARLLRDYAEIAAWSYGRRAEQALVEARRQVLGPVVRHEVPARRRGAAPDARDVAAHREAALAACGCDDAFAPAAYLAWTLGDAASLTVVRDPHAARAADGARDARVVDTLTRHARDARQSRERIGMVVTTDDGRAVLVAYGLVPTERGDTVAYAFTFDDAALAAGLQRIARSDDLLPEAVTHGLPNARLLALRVATPAAVTLSTDARFPTPRWPYQAATRLTDDAAGLRVEAAVRPGAEDALLAEGLPRRRQPLLPALLLLATALALVAVRQLRREQELARLRADFVASVSHELRTPLAQIRLFLETLRLGRWRTEEQRDWLLGNADREATRLAQLVENVLAFARTARGEPSPGAPRESADVGDEVRDAVAAFAPLAAARGVAIAVHAGADVRAPLERAAFRQVLLNLLDNAVKYGPAGQRVSVGVARRRGPARAGRGRHADEIVVTVDDGGPGVPAAQRRRVWEPFARGDGDHVRSAGGSGIGLAIVREIVARHGGRAWLDDAPQGGLRAAVALPAEVAAAADAALGAGVPAPAHVPAAHAEPAHAAHAATATAGAS